MKRAGIDGANLAENTLYRYPEPDSNGPLMVFILDCGKMLCLRYEQSAGFADARQYSYPQISSAFMFTMVVLEADSSPIRRIGLFVNIINFILIISVNQVSKRMTDVGIVLIKVIERFFDEKKEKQMSFSNRIFTCLIRYSGLPSC